MKYKIGDKLIRITPDVLGLLPTVEIIGIYGDSYWGKHDRWGATTFTRTNLEENWKPVSSEADYPIGTIARYTKNAVAAVVMKQWVYNSGVKKAEWIKAQGGEAYSYKSFAYLQSVDNNGWEIIYQPDSDVSSY